jgi:hypothetical protein
MIGTLLKREETRLPRKREGHMKTKIEVEVLTQQAKKCGIVSHCPEESREAQSKCFLTFISDF